MDPRESGIRSSSRATCERAGLRAAERKKPIRSFSGMTELLIGTPRLRYGQRDLKQLLEVARETSESCCNRDRWDTGHWT